MAAPKQILAAAVITSASLVSGSALASAFAVSSGGLTDLMINPNAVGVNLVFNPDSVLTSSASANLTPGGATANNDGATFLEGSTNVPSQCVGTCPPDDTFVPIGMTGQFARGDAQIGITPGMGADTNSVAELFINSVGLTFGFASASNTFSGDFNIDGDSTISFDFSANPYLEVGLSSSSVSGFAQSSVALSFTIADAGGNIVYSESPSALNTSISAVTPGDNAIFNPGNQSFILTTGLLTAGDYDVDISLTRLTNANVNQTAVVPVPVPASLLLLSLGLLGMSRRQRQRG